LVQVLHDPESPAQRSREHDVELATGKGEVRRPEKE